MRGKIMRISKQVLHSFLASVMSTVLIGCATGYTSSGFTGGYSDTQLAPDVFRVTFKGNGYTSAERVQDFALLRAADLALTNGYTHFGILGEASGASQGSFTTPGQSYSTANVQVYGRSAFVTGQTTYIPGQTFTFFKPHTGLMIKCFHGQPEGKDLFDARFVRRSIRQKYKIKES
jgi:hypothetical protein